MCSPCVSHVYEACETGLGYTHELDDAQRDQHTRPESSPVLGGPGSARASSHQQQADPCQRLLSTAQPPCHSSPHPRQCVGEDKDVNNTGRHPSQQGSLAALLGPCTLPRPGQCWSQLQQPDRMKPLTRTTLQKPSSQHPLTPLMVFLPWNSLVLVLFVTN